MLGDVIAEASGSLAGMRLLPAEYGSPKVEITLQGRGEAEDVAFTDLTTYVQIVRPDGTLYGEGESAWFTEDGEVALWRGIGIGRATGPGGATAFSVVGSFHRIPSKLSHLAGVTTAAEYSIDENGEYHWKAWAWEAPEG